MADLLSVDSLTKIFSQGEKELKVLDDLSFNVAAGELIALVGSSGSGKSTLLQLIGLLDHPSDGEIHINGQELASAKEEQRTLIRRNHLGFVYQFHRLLPDFTALENVALAGRIQGMKASAAIAQGQETLTAMGLEDRFDHTPSKLSGGEQQRVAIARALMGNPLLLLADEPTGNLDDQTSERVFNLLTDIVKERGLTCLIATHDRDLATGADRILHLHGGHIETT